MLKKTTIVIACEVLRYEINFLIEKMEERPQAIFLEQGLHDKPDFLRANIQKHIDELEKQNKPHEILMAYGFCFGALHGIRAQKAQLIVPKVHDCIPLILGDAPTRVTPSRQKTQFFWASIGWLKYSIMAYYEKKAKRYQEYCARYDKTMADSLMMIEEACFNSYSSLCYIKWEGLSGKSFDEEVQAFAKEHGLIFTEHKGCPSYLQALLHGGKDRRRFFRVPAGMTLDIDKDGRVVCVPF